MKKPLLLLSFLLHPLLGLTFFGRKYDLLTKSQKKDKNHTIEKWFDTYSCCELDIPELTLIADELHKIINEFDGDVNHLETLLASYCHEIANKHVHTECFLAVVKACEEAILKKFKKVSTFKQTLLAYSNKIDDALHKRDIELKYKVS